METPHTNFRRVSNLIFILAGLDLVGLLIDVLVFMQFSHLYEGLFSVALTAIAALLIRRGYVWFKWVYSIYVIYDLIGFIYALPVFLGIFDLYQFGGIAFRYIMQIVAIFFLFTSHKHTANTTNIIDRDNPIEV